ncbi:MAG: hypothetical protein WA637_06095 [Terriglobales bacterium]
MPNPLRDVHLPADLCEEVERRFAAPYGNLEQFLTFLLRELLRDDAVKMDEAEQRVIEERLRDLGYL